MAPHFFLQRKLHFYLTLAVVATTLFNWFQINSCLIILLVICRLLDGGPRTALRAAFRNPYFIAWFALFVVEVAGLAYTHNLGRGWKFVESKATLAAIPFVLCGGPFTDKTIRNRFLSVYCILLILMCCYCLLNASWLYSQAHDPLLFFYHTLLLPFHTNAVFISAYVISALLFLLSAPLDFGTKKYSPRRLHQWRITFIVFFLAMLIILSSKLLLVVTIIILITFGYKKARPHSGIMRRPILLMGIAVVIGTGLLALTNNPIKDRYKEMTQGDLQLYRKEKLPPFTVFNGVSLRLLMWRSAFEILNDESAWIIGVSAGDAQDLLNKKYFTKINSGFIGFNFHNEYIEILVRSGLLGLALFLAACASLIILANTAGTKEAWFTVIIILLLCLTESMLEMQHPAFYCCFFPLLLQPQRSR